jgi:hypothetical protein
VYETLTKDRVTGRFHRSIKTWKKTHPPAAPFNKPHSGLILILDGLWFQFKGKRYVCYMIVTRTVRGSRARVRGLVLLKGDESEANWMQALSQTLTPTELAQTKAIVADGGHGLVSICTRFGWKYQRCHFHLIKDLQNIAGKRKRTDTSKLRTEILDLVRLILDTPDERAAKKLLAKLRRRLSHPECPKTVKRKVGGFLKHYRKYRTCYDFPELRLPATSNVAEATGHLIRDHHSPMRGLRSVKSLKYWLDIWLRLHTEIRCEPKSINQNSAS